MCRYAMMYARATCRVFITHALSRWWPYACIPGRRSCQFLNFFLHFRDSKTLTSFLDERVHFLANYCRLERESTGYALYRKRSFKLDFYFIAESLIMHVSSITCVACLKRCSSGIDMHPHIVICVFLPGQTTGLRKMAPVKGVQQSGPGEAARTLLPGSRGKNRQYLLFLIEKIVMNRMYPFEIFLIVLFNKK